MTSKVLHRASDRLLSEMGGKKKKARNLRARLLRRLSAKVPQGDMVLLPRRNVIDILRETIDETLSEASRADTSHR